MTRRILPQRRRAETFEVAWGGMAKPFAVTLGFYEDGELGEVFIAGKSGAESDAMACDGAILLSLALQHGTPIATIAGAVKRDASGAPASIIGAAIDRLREALP
ncbi:MAG: hypothetical protein FWD08_00215 [Alphaproteobacteria bacterium]|nr:hypothetical protein [Alphaproteobacteria bacterium]